MRTIIGAVLVIGLVACGSEASNSVPESSEIAPPPLPEGAETVDFDRVTEADPRATTREPNKQVLWGVKEGEPLTIMWEDLMPEGSEKALIREYEEFYAMLEKRYAANMTTLADANDPYAMIEEGSEFDFMPQLGSFETVEELEGELVRIPGYVVPFDFDPKQRWKEFLFVPYMGACIHTPPPPPNQIVMVRVEEPMRVDDIWVPYWIEGTLMTEQSESDLASSAYTLTLDKIEPYPSP
ncbi:MAG: DUF3299 domain-containing protein [Pseudomonadota bacterium]